MQTSSDILAGAARTWPYPARPHGRLPHQEHHPYRRRRARNWRIH